jgi:hypothetical protein
LVESHPGHYLRTKCRYVPQRLPIRRCGRMIERRTRSRNMSPPSIDALKPIGTHPVPPSRL